MRNMVYTETGDDEILENISFKKVFPKQKTMSAASKPSDTVDPKQSGGEKQPKKKRLKLVSDVTLSFPIPEVQPS